MDHTTNPLLAKIKMPGRIFKLPSGGYLYKNGELSHSCHDGEVHVKPMSAFDEIKMKSPDMLFSGEAIKEVFSSCIEEVKNPLELFGRDVDALMCFLRVVTYGPIFPIEVAHTCENAKKHSYQINIEGIVQGIKELDPTTVGQLFTVKLPNDQTVTLEPVRFKHIVELLQSQNQDTPTAADIQNNLIKNLLNMINNIDGISDKALIKEWVEAAPATYITTIADTLEASNEWGPKFEQSVTCLDCGQDFMVEIPMNPVNFFSA